MLFLVFTSVSEIKVEVSKIDEMSNWSHQELGWLGSQSILGNGVTTEANVQVGQSSAEIRNGSCQGGGISDFVVLSIKSESTEIGKIAPVLDDVLNSNAGQIVHTKLKLEVHQISEDTNCASQGGSESVAKLIAIDINMKVIQRSQSCNSQKDFLRSSGRHLTIIKLKQLNMIFRAEK